MRAVALILAAVLLLGCITFDRGGQNASLNNTTASQPPEVPANASANQTANLTNQTAPPPPAYLRYNASAFSFDYPADMAANSTPAGSGGIFTGTHELGNQTFEVMVVTYVDTVAAYGKNKDDAYKLDATQAASDFLLQDGNRDSAGVLDRAEISGNVSTYSIARDAGAAEAPFKTSLGSLDRTYSGYAIDIYVPERSLLVRVRIIALDPSKADAMKQEFLLSFRPE